MSSHEPRLTSRRGSADLAPQTWLRRPVWSATVRIVYLHSGSIPAVYANGVHVMRMCDAFTDAGHDVTLYALPGSVQVADTYRHYGARNRFPIRRVAVPRAAGMSERAAAVRAEVERRGGFDLAYGRDPWSLLAVCGMGPVVYETHLLWDDEEWRQVERLLLRARSLQRVVFVSAALGCDYRHAIPEIEALDMVVAHDGADAPLAVTHPVDLPGRPGATKVGYAGHLYQGRGIELIFGLAAALPDLDFHVVGGTEEDIDLWRRQPSPVNLHLHGYVAPSAVSSYHAAFDIVLAPYQRKVACAGGVGDISRWASPLKLFEYMASGTAMVASDLPVLREILVDRVNCLLCPPEDRTAWAAAVSELAVDEPLRRSLGERARRQLLAGYTWRQRVDRVLQGLDTAGSAGDGVEHGPAGDPQPLSKAARCTP